VTGSSASLRSASTLHESITACEQFSSSTSEVARRQSSRALFPASQGWVPYAEPLTLPAVPSRKVARDDLAFELPRCGASPFAGGALGGTVQDRERRGPSFPLQAVCFQCRQVERRKGQEPAHPAKRSSCEGRRQRLGSGESCRGARPLLTFKTFYSLPASRSEETLPFDLSRSRPW
jgi:hypothetical protein